jgi:hypothetical protein
VSAPRPVEETRSEASGPAPTLTLLGSPDAAVCADGVCEIPGS